MGEKKRFKIHIQPDTGAELAEMHIRNGDLDAARAALSDLPSELVEAILRSAAPLIGTALQQPGSGLPIDPRAEADLRAAERRIVLGQAMLEEAAQLQALLPDAEITVALPEEERRVNDWSEVRASIDGGPWEDARVRVRWTDQPDLGNINEVLSLGDEPLPRRARQAVVLEVPEKATGPVSYTCVTPDGDELSGTGLACLKPSLPGKGYRSEVQAEDPEVRDLVAEWRAQQD